MAQNFLWTEASHGKPVCSPKGPVLFTPAAGWGQGEEVEVLVWVPQPWSGAVRVEIPTPKVGSHQILARGKCGEVCTCHNHREEILSQDLLWPLRALWRVTDLFELQILPSHPSIAMKRSQTSLTMLAIHSNSWAASETYPRGRSSRKALGPISAYIIQAADQQMANPLLPNCVFNSHTLPCYQEK